MSSKRAAAFVDGFNLYHALDSLQDPALKWLDLWRFCERFTGTLELRQVFYFSAYATWLPASYKRHRTYVTALEQVGVANVMGHFKSKDRVCRHCKTRSKSYEEKQTDVNVALHLLNEARKDSYDCALLVSNDSDLVPAIRMLREEFPGKWARVITPPTKCTSKALVQAAGGMQNVRTAKRAHVASALLPERLRLPNGHYVIRPQEYDPNQTTPQSD